LFASARKALKILLDPALAGVMLRSALLTLLMFLVLLAGAEWLIAHLPVLGDARINRALALLAPVLFAFLLAALGAPVAALFGTFFLDRLAGRIEARDYPHALAQPARFAPALAAGLRLAALVLGADILLLPLDLALPGIGEMASIIVNGWLLGWEYFELAALRHLRVKEADALRRTHRRTVWLCGILISLLSAIPVLDLIAPLFGTALMVHLFHSLSREPST
jgi:CysZ protein